MQQGGRTLIIHCVSDPQVRPAHPAQENLRKGQLHAWYSPLALFANEEHALSQLLDDQEHIRADRFKFASDRSRYIIGHGLLRKLLGHYLNQPPQEVQMLRGEFGKPYLLEHPVHFNLSDTKDAVLIAVALEPVGADIETMQRRTDHQGVSEHYFTPPEVASIAASADGKRRFLELWTRKEAVLKACGVGIMDDLKSLNVGEALNTMTIQHPDFVRLVSPEYYVYTMNVGEDHLVSIAASHPIDKLKLFSALPS